MIRSLCIIACGLSLLMCIAATVLWVMSSRPHVWWFGPDRADATAIIVLEQGAFTIHDRVGDFFGHWYSYDLWRPFGAMAIVWISPIVFRMFRSTAGVLLFGLVLNLTAVPLGGAGEPLIFLYDSLLFAEGNSQAEGPARNLRRMRV